MGTYDDQELQKKDKRSSKRASKSKGAWQGKQTFVNLALGRLEKQEIKDVVPDALDFLEHLDSWIEAGYRFSARDYPDDGHVLVSLSGVGDKCQNKDYTVTARAKNLELACVVLIYKVDVMLEEDWSLALDGMA